jgi:hypothetical protein
MCIHSKYSNANCRCSHRLSFPFDRIVNNAEENKKSITHMERNIIIRFTSETNLFFSIFKDILDLYIYNVWQFLFKHLGISSLVENNLRGIEWNMTRIIFLSEDCFIKIEVDTDFLNVCDYRMRHTCILMSLHEYTHNHCIDTE